MAFLHQPDQRQPPPMSLLPKKLALALQLIPYAAFSGEGFQHAGEPIALGNNTFSSEQHFAERTLKGI